MLVFPHEDAIIHNNTFSNFNLFHNSNILNVIEYSIPKNCSLKMAVQMGIHYSLIDYTYILLQHALQAILLSLST